MFLFSLLIFAATMAKKTPTVPVFDLRTAFLDKPHDKYARFILKNKAMALQLIQHFVPAHVLAIIDFDTLEYSSDTFIDDYLREHVTDICYTCQTKDGEKMKITIIIEHKSNKPQYGFVTEQLNRYITNVWYGNRQQKQPLSLILPILLYHGDDKMKRETPRLMFPEAPKEMLQYIPRFNYITININKLSDASIAKIEHILFQKFLLALKHSRHAIFMERNWKIFIIFALDFPDQILANEIFKVTSIYLSNTSNVFNEKVKNMKNTLTASEQLVAKPYLVQLIDESMEKGIEKGMEKLLLAYLKKNPQFKDEQVAEIFDIPVGFVALVRKKM